MLEPRVLTRRELATLRRLQCWVIPGGGCGSTAAVKNTWNKTCVMHGWSGLSFRSDSGKDVADAARHGESASVRLHAGASTFVLFYLSNPIGGNGCEHPATGSAFLLAPPDDTASFRLHLPTAQKICHPVVFPIGRRT